MSKVICGIDPGANGAVAVLRDGTLEVYDLKDCYAPTGSFNSLDPGLFFKFLDARIGYVIEKNNVVIFCEESQTMGDGSKALRSMFDSRGVLRSVCWFRNYQFQYVQPQNWKRYFGLLNTYKSASVEKACELFPNCEELFKRPKRSGGVKLLDGRAEAALIALYGKEKRK
jgi:hypothetical protein